MRGFTTLGLTIVQCYPDTNPFDATPPIWNLSPLPLAAEQYDTQAVREAARAAADSSGYNPFYGAYGTCPLALYDYGILTANLPPITYTAPPPLEHLVLSSPLEFLEAINPTGNTVVFKVRAGERICLLKVFRDREVSMFGYRKPEERPTHPLKRFAREKLAYEHLLRFGACDKGAVPRCFGWLELTAEERDSLVTLPNLTDQWHHLHKDDGLPKALLLEYIDDAEQMTIDSITLERADKALRALYHIHAAHVLHNDVHGRNILVGSGGRVVWIDFDAARTVNQSTESRPVGRRELQCELANTWEQLYNTMLTDKRIGFRSWLE
ncbi:hypothetical protein PHLGIDRAFT_162084 [Phlebiopsis gigantea 11061_1 CR5-6]|uniref:Protein kinase domain-containing protein n=1 Tax=Phlebiopsis gigantea (strain 11061_1 CR5-6) TaxID=745531 RepID=A0A0C3S8D9_PHLG1|nr:hypothetical protein PHLGIDRAFT_162084 [Phlebiopsis gigantea 11061_1 CR5-6]